MQFKDTEFASIVGKENGKPRDVYDDKTSPIQRSNKLCINCDRCI